ncbi:hypothetical protein TWF481_003713 [Arthrobotrys musiformis]|uniref:Uncharacterized protein n=1 Tax=Arthrobotrys musiformis TaxID=47236 RepID=A0AAV9WJA1_9PEZI
MSAIKNRGLFRAQGINRCTTKEGFKGALDKLLEEEETRELALGYLQLVPACNGTQTQVAIFKYQPRTPNFLLKDGQWFELDGNDVFVDSDFYDLTQLFPVDPDSAKIDIVAVSGLNSHALGSWTSPETGKLWLRDFISEDEELKNCRAYVRGLMSREEDRQLLVNSVTNIFFFGVPFKGIDLEDVRSMVEEISAKDPASQGQDVISSIDYETQRHTTTIDTFKRQVEEKQTETVS